MKEKQNGHTILEPRPSVTDLPSDVEQDPNKAIINKEVSLK